MLLHVASDRAEAHVCPRVTAVAAAPHTLRMSAAALCGSLCRLDLTHQLPNAAAISSRRPTTGTGRLDHSSAAVSAEYMRAAGVAAACAGVPPLPGAAAVTTARRRCPAAGVLHGCSCVVCLHSAWSRVLLCLYGATQGPLWCGSGVQHNCCIFQGAAAALLLLLRAQGETLLCCVMLLVD
jgi:hypothetical protein